MRRVAFRHGTSEISLKAVYSVLLLSLIGLACSDGSGTTVIKLAHGLDVTHPVHRAMVRMGELVAEDSGGCAADRHLPLRAARSERECVELLQIGRSA